jgi:adenine-specific DNA-methyltransferase
MPTLHWLNDEEARKTSSQIPYRLLETDTKNSFGDSDSENMLIQGDNLEALKALLPYYAGQVKCIYIDPPYNTGNAFEHYDDNLEHSIWLSLIYPRLELLREILSDDGSIWVSMDDGEGQYLKIIMDEIFGRNNFVSTIIWRKNYAPKSSAKYISEDHDYIFAYAKNKEIWRPNLMPRSDKQDKAYKNPDNDPRGLWRPNNLAARNPYSKGIYPVTTPSGRVIQGPPPGSYWRVSKEKLEELDADGRIWWGKDGNNVPAPKIFLTEVKQGVVPQTFWSYEEVGHTQDAKKESIAFFGNEIFGTPKPEKLIQRVLALGSNPNDIILDSFLGSGTTAAVAHKMGRRYIGIEMGDHAITHCAPRLKKVIEGEQGGISEDVNWQGGGGFNFYCLGETVFDEQGHINSKVKFKSLAAHVWFSETHTPLTPSPSPKSGRGELTPLLGVHNETAFYLLYNGILGDKTPAGGNVLTARVLRELPKHKGRKVIYGEMSMLDESILQKQEITFKHIPYDIKAR